MKSMILVKQLVNKQTNKKKDQLIGGDNAVFGKNI